jgi:predicted small secreted protein
MKSFKNLLLIFVLAAGTLVACDSNDGPMEKAGEKIDKVGKDISDGAEDAAEKVEEAVEK